MRLLIKSRDNPEVKSAEPLPSPFVKGEAKFKVKCHYNPPCHYAPRLCIKPLSVILNVVKNLGEAA